MNIGYVRVLSGKQTLLLQLDALANAECDKIFIETLSESLMEQSSLKEALAYAQAGDTFVVWRLDQLGRSLPHLIEVVTYLRDREIGLRSLTEQIDTTAPEGELIFHLFSALAEFTCILTRERTQTRRTAAWTRGRIGTQPKKLSRPNPLARANAAPGDGMPVSNGNRS